MIENAPSYSGGATSGQRVAILCPLSKNAVHDSAYVSYVEGEALGLAKAIALDVILLRTVKVEKIRPSTYFGQGTLDDLLSELKADDIGLLYIDAMITPIQQRNLEKKLNIKVIDRTGLILEIFGARATTAEGTLQVELAALSYQKSRLVRSWTHLERQRGGFGFIGGPGESQIELDRRMITQRMVRLKKELERVKKTRHLHRQSRQKVPYPIVALVGYTNAGKSSLFNRLTGAKSFAKDLLFATLDPMMRLVKLPSGTKIILSDTVGFISNLPTNLIAAFRATLEEVLQADLILHVRDLTSPMLEAHGEVVCDILGDLGVGLFEKSMQDNNEIELLAESPVGAPRLRPLPKEPVIQKYLEVYNKIDLMVSPIKNDDMQKLSFAPDALGLPVDGGMVSNVNMSSYLSRYQNYAEGDAPHMHTVYISATTGQGVDALLGAIDKALSGRKMRLHLSIPTNEGKFLSWLYEHSVIYEKELIDNLLNFDISIDEKVFNNADRLIKNCFASYMQS